MERKKGQMHWSLILQVIFSAFQYVGDEKKSVLKSNSWSVAKAKSAHYTKE